MATGSEVKRVIQNILNIRKTEVQVRTALVELGLEENISESMFDLVGAAFSLGYERGRAEGKGKATQPEAEPEAEAPTNGEGVYTIRDAIIEVLQQGVMNAAEIHQKLGEQGRMVNRKSIATALCTYKDTFVLDAEKGRGYYRVASNGESVSVHVSVPSAMSAIARYFPKKPFQAPHLAEKMGCSPRNLGVILSKLNVDGFLRVAKKPEGDFPGHGKIWERA